MLVPVEHAELLRVLDVVYRHGGEEGEVIGIITMGASYVAVVNVEWSSGKILSYTPETIHTLYVEES